MDKKIIFSVLMIVLVLTFGCIGAKEQPINKTENGLVDQDNDINNDIVQEPQSTDVKKVVMKYFAYHPNIIKISSGSTIVFENQEGNTKHQIVSGPVENFRSKPDGLFESTELAEGETWEYTFTESGEFPFHSPKYTKMQGMIIVGDAVNEVIQITTPNFVGSTPVHEKKLDSLNDIWITFNVPISDGSEIKVYDVVNKEYIALKDDGIDISNYLRLKTEFAETLEPSLYKVEYVQDMAEGRYEGQFFFYIEQ